MYNNILVSREQFHKTQAPAFKHDSENYDDTNQIFNIGIGWYVGCVYEAITVYWLDRSKFKVSYDSNAW